MLHITNISRFLTVLLFATFACVASFAQSHVDIHVCVGQSSVFRVEGSTNTSGLNDYVSSNFEYKLELSAEGLTMGQITLEDADSVIIRWGNVPGIVRLGVREQPKFKDFEGCFSDWYYINISVGGDHAEFSKPEYFYCDDEGVFIELVNKDKFNALSWTDPAVADNGSNGFFVNAPGIYELQTIDKNQCIFKSTVNVVQHHTTKVTLPDLIVACEDEIPIVFTAGVATANPSGNTSGTMYSLYHGTLTELGRELRTQTELTFNIVDYVVTDTAVYWVRSLVGANADFEGCSASDYIVIHPCPDEWFIPNTFTPNADGDNDVWNIVGIENYPNAEVEVFDRWGRRVFHSRRGYSTPWDGRHYQTGRELPTETYYYIIRLNDTGRRISTPLQGTITIIR